MRENNSSQFHRRIPSYRLDFIQAVTCSRATAYPFFTSETMSPSIDFTCLSCSIIVFLSLIICVWMVIRGRFNRFGWAKSFTFNFLSSDISRKFTCRGNRFKLSMLCVKVFFQNLFSPIGGLNLILTALKDVRGWNHFISILLIKCCSLSSFAIGNSSTWKADWVVAVALMEMPHTRLISNIFCQRFHTINLYFSRILNFAKRRLSNAKNNLGTQETHHRSHRMYTAV